MVEVAADKLPHLVGEGIEKAFNLRSQLFSVKPHLTVSIELQGLIHRISDFTCSEE